jgi:hypothetical protein
MAINWDTHRKALSQLSQQHTQLTKMHHEILPTTTITSQYDPKTSPLCPICKAKDEDRDHVMQCADPTKGKWQQSFISSIQKRYAEMKNKRNADNLILTDGLAHWFNDKHLEAAECSPPFHQLSRQQNEIGWRQLFNGRFVSEWQWLQNQHPCNNGRNQRSYLNRSILRTTSLIVQLCVTERI